MPIQPPSPLRRAGLVDWPAVFAGTAVTTAIALVLLTFGGALGVSMASPPYEGEAMAPAAFAVAAGLRLLGVPLPIVLVLAFCTGDF